MASIASNPRCIAARAAGETKFNAGCKCDKGHVSLRDTRNGKCVTCGVIGDWTRRHGKTETDYWQEGRARKAAAKANARNAAARAVRVSARKAKMDPDLTMSILKARKPPAVIKPMTLARAHTRSRRLPMIGGDFDPVRTQALLEAATEKYLRLLYAEAMAALKDRPHA